MALGDLEVKGNTTLDGTLVVVGTTNLGAALDTNLVTNFNADKVDGADLSTDGTLAANSDVLVPSQKAVKTYADLRALDSAVVHDTGNETVAGIKTFSSIPLLPASDPTTDNQAARKKYIADLDAANVKLTENQAISGIKSFTGLLQHSKGLQVVNKIYQGAALTENVIFDVLDQYIPDTNDTMLVCGAIKSGTTTYIISYALRYDATHIYLYGISTAGTVGTLDLLNGGSEEFASTCLAW